MCLTPAIHPIVEVDVKKCQMLADVIEKKRHVGQRRRHSAAPLFHSLWFDVTLRRWWLEMRFFFSSKAVVKAFVLVFASNEPDYKCCLMSPPPHLCELLQLPGRHQRKCMPPPPNAAIAVSFLSPCRGAADHAACTRRTCGQFLALSATTDIHPGQ